MLKGRQRVLGENEGGLADLFHPFASPPSETIQSLRTATAEEDNNQIYLLFGQVVGISSKLRATYGLFCLR